MLTQRQLQQTLQKLERLERTLDPYLFQTVDQVPNCRAMRTQEDLHALPDTAQLKEIAPGYTWGAEGEYCWFVTQYTVPAHLAGADLFLKPHIGGYEGLLWVDGVPFGTYNTKIVFTDHGNHYCNLICQNARAGQTIDIAIEYYAGHIYKGNAPLEERPNLPFHYHYEGMDICVKDRAIQDFYFDLRIVNQMVRCLPADSYLAGQVQHALYQAHNALLYAPLDCEWEDFLAGLRAAHPFLREILEQKNGPQAPIAGIIGHSHMDTAWLWHVGETVKKCARTYANQISLMQQYPEYTFVQSSACHSNMIRVHYPALFQRMQEQVASGHYEPNGGVWVECDCNITGAESMVRQFIWGQRFTRKYFNYTANCFWLPDTFGYSAAIPQIMKGCGVDYFLTTKLSWNDTNTFPYDTFWWQGLDGTKVLTHFNQINNWPDAENLYTQLRQTPEKSVTQHKLISYGYGDGGGGPQYEMLESARRCQDLAGIPKASHVRVGDFMQEIEQNADGLSTHTGELYLELHRGTLTNQHEIKRLNRKAEIALHDLEYLVVAEAIRAGETAQSEVANPLYETLLLNQFHDILPGTCIPRAHQEARTQNMQLLKDANALIADLLHSPAEDCITLTNTLSFARNDVLFLNCPAEYCVAGDYPQQHYTNLDGAEILIVSGVSIPAFSSVTLQLIPDHNPQKHDTNVFLDHTLTTPFARIHFDKNGYMDSFIDTRLNRELVAGKAFNTFLLAEDVPADYDNWDIDADIAEKLHDTATLLSQEIVSAGDAAVIIRSNYRLTARSTLTQDMQFFWDTPEVRFDTVMDWQDDHRLLKAAFDTSLQQEFARHEMQFGYIRRPTTRNNSLEKAKFEVVNHKYTDLSEARYGVAILNDCKYGISAEGGSLQLSLHKGGTRPDHTGDHGRHRCRYAFLPHNSDFGAQAVIQPAYCFNLPPLQSKGSYTAVPLVQLDADNVIVESIKPCEDSTRAFIVRLYEAEGAYTPCTLRPCAQVSGAAITNMLEEVQQDLGRQDGYSLTFRPFEIKTLRLQY